MRHLAYLLLGACAVSAILAASACDDGATDTLSSGDTSSASGNGSSSSGGGACTPGEKQDCYGGPEGTQGVGACKAGEQTCDADGSGFGACVGDVRPAAEDCATAADDDCDGEVNQPSAGCICAPGATEACYDGPLATKGVGVCVEGTRTCAADGKSFGACAGQVLPMGTDDCATGLDEDCTGMVNESCACEPNTIADCYSGPPSTLNVSVCKGGTQTCNAEGTGYGGCVGEVLPQSETCNTPIDDDCDGQTNEEGAGCVCPPNQMAACYTGPAATANVGLCKPGLALCNDQGTALGTCVGDVTPQPETCNTPGDDDCDGQTNESGAGCVCLPGSTQSCYTGPVGTAGVGVCTSGTRTCNAQGTGFGACVGEVTPQPTESCMTAADDNCNGQVNEGCTAVTYAADVRPILQSKCAPCHTVNGSGGANFASSYADTQLSSYYCPGKTKGACTIVRIQEGSMPQGAGCTGNPTVDAGKPQCLTAAQQSTIQAWIAGGQLP